MSTEAPTYHIISHTHWDREWYLPFEQFRIMLVRMLDGLLELLDREPDYRFHLDAQTILLDDYLDIRPERREELRMRIREGRLLIGPWYVQNDFYLSSGEATIRNLEIGIRAAEEFGGGMRIGYAADQFGVISQLPQILQGFGIDSFIFGRGFDNWIKEGDEWVLRPAPTEFVWEGADGSRVDAFHMAFWYNNAQRFSADRAKAGALLRGIRESALPRATTPHLLCMNGVDHLAPQDDLLEILSDLSATLPPGETLRQSTLAEYVDAVRRRLEIEDPRPLIRGELREGRGDQILHGTLSTRSYLKYLNVEAQNQLEAILEPLYALLELAGFSGCWPESILHYLWKTLLSNLAHDSICGCSADRVHAAMVDRYARIEEAADFLEEEALDLLSRHWDCGGAPFFIAVVNTQQDPRSEVLSCELHFPADLEIASFRLYDSENNKLSFEVLHRERMLRNAISPINLPGNLEVDSFHCLIESPLTAGFGFSTIRVVPDSHSATPPAGTGNDRPVPRIENEYLSVGLHENGTVELRDADGRLITESAIVLEDDEDCGDVYLYRDGPVKELYSSTAMPLVIEEVVQAELESRITWHSEWDLPLEYLGPEERRSAERGRLTTRITLRLRKHDPYLTILFEIDNEIRDHRLRWRLESPAACDTTLARAPFSYEERSRIIDDAEIRGRENPFAGVLIHRDSEGRGIALLSRGIHGYEHDPFDPSLLRLTLLRANKYILKGFDGENMRNDLWQAAGNQCPGTTRLEAALLPLTAGDKTADIERALRRFLTPLRRRFQATDARILGGGRPGVQDPAVSEIFYPEDRFPELKITPGEILQISGAEVSCLKLNRSADMIILRIVNLEADASAVDISYAGELQAAYRLDLAENLLESIPIADNADIALTLKPGEIATCGLVTADYPTYRVASESGREEERGSGKRKKTAALSAN